MTTQPPTPNQTDPSATVCYRHPKTETGLRCAKCDRYICIKCANRTPVGYICPECLREREDKFYSGSTKDYIIAVLIALPLSTIAVLVFTYLIGGFGFFSWIISFFAAPFTAGLIAEAVRKGIGRRRSRYMWQVVAGCLIAPSTAMLLLMLLAGTFWAMIPPTILLMLGISTFRIRLF